MQVWTSTKPLRGSLGDCHNQHASLGEPIQDGSLYSQILAAIGVTHKDKQTLSAEMLEQSSSSMCVQVEQCTEGSHAENAALSRKKARKCALPESMGEAICLWWDEHHRIAVNNLGPEICAHVHAAAVSVATSNFEAGVFPDERSFTEVFSAACHTMALKYVVGDRDLEAPEQSLVVDIEGVLAEWRALHAPGQIHFAEVTMLKHGMYRLRKFVYKL